MPNTRALPVLPLRGMTVFPYMIVHLDVGRERSVEAIEHAMLEDKRVLLLTQRQSEIEAPERADLYEIGTVAEVRQLLKMPDGTLRVLVEGLHRGIVLDYEQLDTYDEATTEEHIDEEVNSMEMEALSRGVSHEFEEWVKLTRKIPTEALVSVAIIDDAGRLADLIASHLNLKVETKQEILSCIELMPRLKKLYAVLAHELEIMRMEQKIGAQVREQMEKVQKDFYLREKIKAIRKELGDNDGEARELEALKKRLEEGVYPDEVKKVIQKEMKRLEGLSFANPETGVIRTYLDWLLDLPWCVETEITPNLSKAKKVLNEDHYGLEKVKERILDYLAVQELAKDKHAPILCLVGPPGVGKTSLAASVARATGRKFVRASLGGIRDEAEIRGHRRTYVGALPGRIIEKIKLAGAKNPVFLLDEVDKLGNDYRGDPASAMLEVLDPAQNSTFSDHYIELPFDLSKVLWIITANDLGAIPRALRDRMEIITLSSYTGLEKLEIAKRYLVARQREENGLSAKDISISASALEQIIQSYTRESGVRELERVIGRVCRKAARRLVEGVKPPIRVTKKNLTDFLGRAKFLETKAEKEPQVGVVTGMAWTAVGGEILPTEATVLPGKGKLILTGKLGEVMQESARAGLTYIRSRAKELGISEDFYEKDDIHVHLPEGAVPKDGPSAGITMATAMISALTQRRVRSDVAMTGEITLRGNVLPIGGLKEKTLAAYREGMKTIIIPKSNERDLEDIPDSVREKLEFIPAEHMDKVLEIALLDD